MRIDRVLANNLRKSYGQQAVLLNGQAPSNFVCLVGVFSQPQRKLMQAIVEQTFQFPPHQLTSRLNMCHHGVLEGRGSLLQVRAKNRWHESGLACQWNETLQGAIFLAKSDVIYSVIRFGVNHWTACQDGWPCTMIGVRDFPVSIPWVSQSPVDLF